MYFLLLTESFAHFKDSVGYLKATVHFLEEVLISLDTLHAKEEVGKGNAESTEQTKKVSFYSFHYFLVS